MSRSIEIPDDLYTRLEGAAHARRKKPLCLSGRMSFEGLDKGGLRVLVLRVQPQTRTSTS